MDTDAMISAIIEELKNDEKLTLIVFGYIASFTGGKFKYSEKTKEEQEEKEKLKNSTDMKINPNDLNDIGKKIKSIRLANNLTQAEFAEKICISQTHLSKVEAGKEKPSMAVIRLIKLQFNV